MSTIKKRVPATIANPNALGRMARSGRGIRNRYEASAAVRWYKHRGHDAVIKEYNGIYYIYVYPPDEPRRKK